MLRLLGAIVLLVLILGPLLMQVGVLENAGLFKELVELEIRAFSQLVEFVRTLINGHT